MVSMARETRKAVRVTLTQLRCLRAMADRCPREQQKQIACCHGERAKFQHVSSGFLGLLYYFPDKVEGDQLDGKAVMDVGNRPDRKSTRLNSSHVRISYAVFCLKKKSR